MPTITTDTLQSFNVLSARLKVDMSDVIYLLEPNAAPLTVLLNRLNKNEATNPRYEWLEDTLMPNWSNITNNAGTGTTITLGPTAGSTAHWNYVVPYTLIRVPSTGEVMLVTSVNSANGQITVVRGYGTSSSSIDGSTTPVPVVILGPAYPEGVLGSQVSTPTTLQENQYNYIQVFTKQVKVSRIADKTATYGGKIRVTEQQKKGIEILRDIENAFLFGVRYLDTTRNIRTTGGALFFISSNVTANVGTLTYAAVEAFLRNCFRYGRTRKFLFCSPLVMSAFSMLAESRGHIHLVPRDVAYGLSIKQWNAPHGEVMLITDVNLTGTVYGGMGILLEIEECAFRYMQDVTLETNVQNPSDQLYIDQYVAYVGFELHNEQKHGVISGVTGV